MDYKTSGVDIEAGENAVQRIKSLVRKTYNQNVLTELGSFGGLYQIDLSKWKAPVMVASTDGVGTKLIVAQRAGIFDTVGQDLVNHCVNDIFVQGAEPQYFMDYIGCGKLDPEKIEQIISGMTKACLENGMSLIGGEMAEMPGIYQSEDFDLVGTITGLIEKNRIITGEAIQEGDIIIGFKGNGLHTNGYSLARKIFFDVMKKDVTDYVPELQETVAEALLKVHPSYYPCLKNWTDPAINHGMAHITGGGLPGNVKRVIPDGLCATIDTQSWKVPDIFRLMQESAKISNEEMFKAFNMGIGFVVIVDPSYADQLCKETEGFKIGIMTAVEKSSKVMIHYT
ncbi:MAG TPA: phosphoribosylformylglycinamidine cyclo-ligase [Candidatus Cloacimonadota bacterium]|nr:phosphoribosylformylglycinamidine cyclo-ligase [Candidatus Cloacimonadota bacterium]HPM03283.1 phosphoribosylformylglycinamidine cyclo-ligase [Candidatus Cloacimonadota bacterium]